MLYPALDVHCNDSGLLLALVDDFSPTAIEERDDAIRVFFSSASSRDTARAQLSGQFEVASIDVPDEDWARRSQQNLQSVTIGRITVFPNPALSPQPLALHIPASMGFGTGHHATTRLCLEALQTIDLRGKTVLDAGTGSGILAIAAARLGATRAIGLDDDGDAIQAARENLALNPTAGVAFETGDLRSAPLGTADVVTANLTGALLIRAAALLLSTAQPAGSLILSGLRTDERDEVVSAFRPATVSWERQEDEWVAFVMSLNHPAGHPV